MTIVVAVIAVVGLTWLVRTAWVQSQPAVSGDVAVWNVESDQRVRFTLTVDRRDPGVPVGCRVIAQAANHQTVGEKTIELDPGEVALVDVRQTMRTIRKATSVSLDQCWLR